jgi:type VI secretion system protein ImpB
MMKRESYQHDLDRVRRPRVQITYDVETEGAMERLELPFVVGVLADLSGHPAEALKPLKERKFVAIDRDNIDDVLRRSKPRLAMTVPNHLAGDNSKLPVELTFGRVDDFDPGNVVKKVAVLSSLLEARHRLSQLLGKMEGNEQLEAELAAILGDAGKAKELADALGIKPKSLPAGNAPPAGTATATGAAPAATAGTAPAANAAAAEATGGQAQGTAAEQPGAQSANPQVQDPSKQEETK